jgi:hypothetical protein
VLGSLDPDEIRRMAARAPLPEPPHRPLFQQVLEAALVALGLAVLGCTHPSNQTTAEVDAKPGSLTAPARADEEGAMLPPETDDGPPLPDLRTTRKRNPLYGLKGPSVMPDPHLAKKLAMEAEASLPSPELQNVVITLGDKVIHNDKDLDGFIQPPREDFPHLPGARKRDPLYGLMGPRVMPDPHFGAIKETELRSWLDRQDPRDIPSIFGPDPAAGPGGLQNVGAWIGDKVIHNDKDLDGAIKAPRRPRGKSK